MLTTNSSSKFVHFKTALVGVGGADTHRLVETWFAQMGEDASEPEITVHADVRRSHSCLVPSTLGTDNGFAFAFHMLAYTSERPLAEQLHEAVDRDVDSIVLWLGPDADRASGTAALAQVEAWLRASGHVAPERCPLVLLSEGDLASQCGAPPKASTLHAPESGAGALDVLKHVAKSLLVARREGDVVERDACSTLRVGTRVVLMPTGVMTVEAIGPRDALTPHDRVNIRLDAARLLEGQSPFAQVHADDTLVYALKFPDEEEAFQLVPVQAAAKLGLRSVSWPASIDAFLGHLREAARQGPFNVSDERTVSVLFSAGNSLEALAWVYPSLAAAATRSSDARRKLDQLTGFMVEEMTTVLGISPAQARTRIEDAAAARA